MNKNLLRNNEDGFTLIEIIAVLVILGILAAVAVPKFFDLQDRAKQKAVEGAIAEMKVRVNQQFARELLDGDPTPDYTADLVDTNLGDEFTVDTWTVNGTTSISYTITYHKGQDDEKSFSGTIELPKLGA